MWSLWTTPPLFLPLCPLIRDTHPATDYNERLCVCVCVFTYELSKDKRGLRLGWVGAVEVVGGQTQSFRPGIYPCSSGDNVFLVWLSDCVVLTDGETRGDCMHGREAHNIKRSLQAVNTTAAVARGFTEAVWSCSMHIPQRITTRGFYIILPLYCPIALRKYCLNIEHL